MMKVRLPRLFAVVALLVTSAFAPTGAQTSSCTPPPSGMTSWWPGDGNANDIAGNLSGALSGGATYAPGRVGQSFSLNGTTGRVVMPSFLPTDNITVDAWINLSGPPLGVASIWGVGNAGGTQGSVIWVDQDMARFALDIFTPSSGRFVWYGAFNFSANQWYHIAVTQSGGPTATPAMYVNGASVAVTPWAGNTGTPTHQSLPMAIGAYGGAYTTQYFFNGQIDEVEVFNRALSSTEIFAIYNAGSAGKCKPSVAAVPTPVLSVWSLATLAVLLGLAGFWFIARNGRRA
jgi:hypothetical protein